MPMLPSTRLPAESDAILNTAPTAKCRRHPRTRAVPKQSSTPPHAHAIFYIAACRCDPRHHRAPKDEGDCNASPTVSLTTMRFGGGELFEEPRDDQKNGERWIKIFSQTNEKTKSHLIGSSTSTSLLLFSILVVLYRCRNSPCSLPKVLVWEC